MSPPPLTPAPRRFLLPSAKRSEQTPASSSYARGQQSQFHSTPKFAPSSTPWSTRQAPQSIEEVEDAVDEDDDQGEGSSLFGQNGKDEAGHGTCAKILDDGIERGNTTVSNVGNQRDTKRGHQRASIMDEGMWDDDEGISRDDGVDGPYNHQVLHSPNKRLYKRQRVSLSPDIESESLLSDHGLDHGQTGGNAPEDITHAFAKPSDDEPSPTPVGAEDDHDSHDSDEQYDDSSPNRAQGSRAPNQPTFLAAPRFRAPSPSSLPAEILPTAFSPQRRGQQFLAGGMAATLQTQLSAIKSWEGPSGSTPQPTTTSPDDGERAGGDLMLQVVEFRAGKRMYLIRGLAVAEQGNRRVILAGEGTLTGLGRRARLRVGDKVKVRRPVWEVVIEGETWLVACDWNVSL